MSTHLNGDLQDSCAICARGTDTGLGVRGNRRWLEVSLEMMGIEAQVAHTMVEIGLDKGAITRTEWRVPVPEDPSTPGEPWLDMLMRVCASCVASVPDEIGFPQPGLVLMGGDLPTITGWWYDDDPPFEYDSGSPFRHDGWHRRLN